MILDTRAKYKVVKVKEERLVKTLLNKIVIKLRETNDMYLERTKKYE